MRLTDSTGNRCALNAQLMTRDISVPPTSGFPDAVVAGNDTVATSRSSTRRFRALALRSGCPGVKQGMISSDVG